MWGISGYESHDLGVNLVGVWSASHIFICRSTAGMRLIYIFHIFLGILNVKKILCEHFVILKRQLLTLTLSVKTWHKEGSMFRVVHNYMFFFHMVEISLELKGHERSACVLT